MKPIAPGTVIFHRHRGYGVITSVNLLTGWISARFGSEPRTLDLNLSTDEVQHADGEPILFRRAPPDRMPHARLMAMVRELHRAGYQRLYLYSWPKPSGLHWRWHSVLRPAQLDAAAVARRLVRLRRRLQRQSGAGLGRCAGRHARRNWSSALAQFDPQGLAQALGRDEDHTAWFETVCEALLPDYAYSLGWERGAGCR